MNEPRLTSDQKDGIAKFTRGNLVLAIYRWLIEVAFLFAAFTEFPDHKWSIGLGLLAFNGATAAVARTVVGEELSRIVRDDGERRKTRHAIILAAEQRADSLSPFDQERFWDEVARRVAAEYKAADEYADKPTGFWLGSFLAVASLAWQLVASLFGIALVAALTS